MFRRLPRRLGRRVFLSVGVPPALTAIVRRGLGLTVFGGGALPPGAGPIGTMAGGLPLAAALPRDDGRRAAPHRALVAPARRCRSRPGRMRVAPARQSEVDHAGPVGGADP